MKRLSPAILLVALLLPSAVSFADPVLFKMEGGNMSKTDTYVDPVWDTITLSHVYDSPLIFIIPRNDGSHPADFRIRNITPGSFEATVVEPPGYDGPHVAMTVSYIVAEEGNWFLTPDRFMTVGAVDVADLVNSQGGSWVTVPIPQGYTNPIVLAQIQGFANELNNLPSEFSIPWVTASVRNVTATSFEVSLDGGRCTNVTTHADPDCVGPYTLAPERIAYLVIEGNVQDSFVDADGKTILLETIKTGSNIIGWSDGGTYVNFSTSFTQAPLFVAKPQTRNEPDGGWFRFSGLSAAGMTLLVEEALGDTSARNHNSPGETGGVLAFSENFRVEDLDPDKDLVPIPYDNCPFVANATQTDVDGDGVGDACDCGDGIRAYTEICDDGNLTDGDGCDSNCLAEPGWICIGSPSVCDGMCGDGMVIGSELCDDGNLTDDPECHSDCQSFCGDGVRDYNHGESCDGAQMGIHTCLTLGYGFTGGVLACSATCAYDTSGCTTCGDGVAAGDELCDDGNLATGDGCNAYCTPEVGWDCTDPHNCLPVCGDGLVKGDELCDDGNLADGDGCSALCTPESGWECSDPANCIPLCGDGVLTGPELCDDGNTDAGDGCSPTCSPESGYDCVTVPGSCSPICGDGILVVEEACDDGNLDTGDGCDDTCSWEEGWDCTGNDCVAICGDGMVLGSEGCDDGNLDTGDGCDDTCVEESGWSCTGEPSTCAQTCGDGVLQEGEACDDGNLTPGDGCADNCNVEIGWLCEGEPSVCEELQTPCGNGVIDEGEGCDDGNLTDGDGCAADCTVEAGWACPAGDSCCVDEDSDGECDDGGLGSAGSGCTCQAARNSESPAMALLLLLLLGLYTIRRTVAGTRFNS